MYLERTVIPSSTVALVLAVAVFILVLYSFIEIALRQSFVRIDSLLGFGVLDDRSILGYRLNLYARCVRQHSQILE